MHMTHILIVEDDAVLSSGIVLVLKENARHFTQCADISSAKAAFLARQFELVILDINLPDGSGLELCRWIRDMSEVPVLFLTANDTEMDIVLGLETGGDDYLTKPFSLAVLRARVSALLRRGGAAGTSSKIEIDRFSFDFERMIFEKDGAPIELSKTEQRLLFLLVQNKGQSLSREKLSERVWQDGTDYVDENALSVAIRRLRGKLEDDPSAPAYIKTVFGVGYTWAVK
jgi:DNA-binding response OmpR family regulator